VAWMACEHFGADYVLATIHEAHQAFYWRIFGRTLTSEARLYPGIAKPVYLLVWDYRQIRDRVNSRYPYLISTEGERRAIFGSKPSFAEGLEEFPGGAGYRSEQYDRRETA
jgi:hypothetical protein